MCKKIKKNTKCTREYLPLYIIYITWFLISLVIPLFVPMNIFVFIIPLLFLPFLGFIVKWLWCIIPESHENLNNDQTGIVEPSQAVGLVTPLSTL